MQYENALSSRLVESGYQLDKSRHIGLTGLFQPPVGSLKPFRCDRLYLFLRLAYQKPIGTRMNTKSLIKNTTFYLILLPLYAQAMSAPPASVYAHGEGQSCNHMSVGTCTLPFPSNQYTRPDASSPTGLKLDLQGTLFSKAAEEAIDQFSSNDIYADKNGFSAAAPVLFEVPEAFAKNSLPVDGGEALIVFNRDTGLRANVRTELVEYAAKQQQFGDTAATVIEAFPRGRFEFGANYVAVLTKVLKPVAGGDYIAAPAVQNLAAGTASAAVQSSYGSAFDYVLSQGVAARDIISLTTFTVTNEHGNNAELYDLIDVVESEAHPVRNLRTLRFGVGPVAAIIKGELRLSDLRDPVSGRVRYSPGMQGREYWTDFVLELPRAARYGKVPVVIYGHGISVFKETASFTVSLPNASLGVATMYIDQPYHGSRIDQDGDSISSLPTPDNIPRIAGMVAQSTLDLHSVISALKTSLADLNVVPANNWWNRTFLSEGVNSVDIDTDQIYYQGTSLGGVFGSAFASSARDLKGAFMHVTGVGVANILSHSVLFELLKFNEMIPEVATGGDAALFFHAVQTEIDLADGINFVHYGRQGAYGRLPRPMAIQYGVGDDIVFNRSSEAFAEIADLPLVGEHPLDIAHLRESADFEDGYGVVQTPALIPTGTGADKLLGHVSFLRLDSVHQMKNWLAQMIEQ